MIRAYGVLGPGGLVRRSIFIVDPEGIVRYRHVALLGLHYQDVEDLKRIAPAGAGRGAGLRAASRRSWRAPSSRPSSRSSGDGRRLAGESIGDGPPIVLLHGHHGHPPLRGPRLEGPGSARLSPDLLRRARPRRVRSRPAGARLLLRRARGRPGGGARRRGGRPARWCSRATRWGPTPPSPTRSRTATGSPAWCVIGPVYMGFVDEEALAGWDRLADGLERGGVEGFMEAYDRGLRPGLARDGPALHPPADARAPPSGGGRAGPARGAALGALRGDLGARVLRAAGARGREPRRQPIRAIPTRWPPPTRRAFPRRA